MSWWGDLERLVQAPPFEQRAPITGERRLVATGVVLSALLLAFGLTRVVIGHEPVLAEIPRAHELIRGLRALCADAALLAGLLVLALTPVARLLWIAMHFARRKERTMAGITLLALALIAMGVALAPFQGD